MNGLVLPEGPILAVGAHADDIEIGAAGLILHTRRSRSDLQIRMAVFTGDNIRREEAVASARDLAGSDVTLDWLGATDGMLPYQHAREAKEFLRTAASASPAVVLTPQLDDAHQDHRFVSELVWQVCRGAMVIEYLIPKWDPEPKRANLYQPLDDEIAEAKLDHLDRHFASQHGKPWYRRITFDAVLRSHGVGCGSERAEAFIARKVLLK